MYILVENSVHFGLDQEGDRTLPIYFYVFNITKEKNQISESKWTTELEVSVW